MKRKLLLFIILVFVLSMLSSCKPAQKVDQKADPTAALVSNFKTLNITALGAHQTGTVNAADDVLTPIWRAKTKVIPEYSDYPDATANVVSWVQMQIAAGTWFDVVSRSSGMIGTPDINNLLKKAGMLKEIKLADIKKYMPRTADRLNKLGVTVDQWYAANVDPADGKLWYVPNLPSLNLSSEYRKIPAIAAQVRPNPYFLWFRDDILKKIYPKAKTEAELNQLYVKKGGNLTINDIMDIPMNTPEDMNRYLTAVKKLNLKQGNKPIIPGELQSNNSVGALMWSMFTFAGFYYNDDYPDTPYNMATNQFNYYATTPQWKTYMSQMNSMYNDGLFGSEYYIQKDDQRDAKLINGEYAVMHWWAPVIDARNLSVKEKRGYGFRLYPIFLLPTKSDAQDSSSYIYRIAQPTGGKAFNPKTVTDAMMPQLLSWVDWNYSMEAAQLKAWGPESFSTGTGMDRRFKPQYKAIEDYKLMGKKGGKDGIYYGILTNGINGGDYSAYNPEVYDVGNFDSNSDPYSPEFVYPPKSVGSVDQGVYVVNIVRMALAKTSTLYKEGALGKDAMDAKAAYNKTRTDFSKIDKVSGIDTPEGQDAIIKAITGKPADFEKNYATYFKTYTPEFKANIAQQKSALFKFFNLEKEYMSPLK
jgi:hypothetical protein